MPLEDLQVDGRVTIPGGELELRTTRSSGPGGQHVNKVETAVELRFALGASTSLSNNDKSRIRAALGHRLSGEAETLMVRASAQRSRARNLADARERLASLIAAAIAPRKSRRATKPTRGSKRRRLDAKKKRGDLKRQRRSKGED